MPITAPSTSPPTPFPNIPASITTPVPPPPPPPHITIAPVNPSTLPAYRRLITTLLPIRYQDKYYAESIANQTSSSLALCAIWCDPHAPTSPPASNPSNGTNAPRTKGEVVAGIQCRLEPLPPSPATSKPSPSNSAIIRHPPVSPRLNGTDPLKRQLYISTLCTLAPHRSRGIATALLDRVVYTLLTHPEYAQLQVTELYAHVWEANGEALEWYRMRGFEVGEAVGDYYRRLRPSGARVVRRRIGVVDYVGVGGRVGFGAKGEGVGSGDGDGGGDVGLEVGKG